MKPRWEPYAVLVLGLAFMTLAGYNVWQHHKASEPEWLSELTRLHDPTGVGRTTYVFSVACVNSPGSVYAYVKMDMNFKTGAFKVNESKLPEKGFMCPAAPQPPPFRPTPVPQPAPNPVSPPKK